MHQSVEIAGRDGQFGGYLALPKSGRGPGIVVLQEIFGVNHVMRQTCDWLAEEGFCALCPDLFWRIEPGIDITDQTPEEIEQAFSLFGAFNVDTGIIDAQATLAFLQSHAACTGKVGTIGYCLGGKLAYLSATRTKTDASVGYYGVAIDEALDEASKIVRPLLLHIAQKDEFVPPQAVAAMHAALDPNPLVTLYDYAGQSHAFARPGGAHYNASAAALANSRSLEFLKNNLG